MMSAALIEAYISIGNRIHIYIGSLLFVLGMIGNTLNIVVFLSLKTFRQNSCAFYLIIMSVANIGAQLLTLLPRLLTLIFGIDGTELSLFYCKCRIYVSTMCTTISLTCFCLATIDQYCATCSRARFQQWSNIKLAKRTVIFVVILWILHATPYLFLFYHSVSPITGKTKCVMTNIVYIQYRMYVIVLVFYGLLPEIVSILFGILAHRNLKQLAHYTIPLVRRELDKQLTAMVLRQVLISSLILVPYVIMYTIQIQTTTIYDQVIVAQIQFVYTIMFALSNIYHSVNLSRIIFI